MSSRNPSGRILVAISCTFCLVALLLPGLAHAFCVEPDASLPPCLDQVEEKEFKSEQEYNSCREQVDHYVQTMERWSRCVQQEAILRSNEAIERFNCKVRGEHCP